MADLEQHKIRLTQEQMDQLSKLPESGMGYQIVNITLENGKKLNHRKVVNSEYILLENEDIDAEEIKKLELNNP